MNTVVELIEKENLTLEKDYGVNGYAYIVGKQMITYPAFDDLNHLIVYFH